MKARRPTEIIVVGFNVFQKVTHVDRKQTIKFEPMSMKIRQHS